MPSKLLGFPSNRVSHDPFTSNSERSCSAQVARCSACAAAARTFKISPCKVVTNYSSACSRSSADITSESPRDCQRRSSPAPLPCIYCHINVIRFLSATPLQDGHGTHTEQQPHVPALTPCHTPRCPVRPTLLSQDETKKLPKNVFSKTLHVGEDVIIVDAATVLQPLTHAPARNGRSLTHWNHTRYHTSLCAPNVACSPKPVVFSA